MTHSFRFNGPIKGSDPFSQSEQAFAALHNNILGKALKLVKNFLCVAPSFFKPKG
jgi:hypothetical protein